MSSKTTFQTDAPAFVGKYAFGSLLGFLAAEEMRKEVLIKMQERFGNTAAVVGLPSLQELRTARADSSHVILASNPYLLAAYNSVGAEYGTQGILPCELEQVIAGGKWQKGMCYADTGLALDFSGINHALALDLYEQLPAEQKQLEGWPLVVGDLHLEKTNAREGFSDYLRFMVHTGTQYWHAPVLARNSGYFAVNDAGLCKTGLPEIVSKEKRVEGERYLWVVPQKERKIGNIGISRFYLGSGLSVDAGNGSLAGSLNYGRVVPVDSEAVVPKKITSVEKRTFSDWDVEIDETRTVSAQMPEQYQRKMKIVEALEGREDLTDEEVRAVEEILKKGKES